MIEKAKDLGLVACLFVFLSIVIGGGLHLTPGATLLAATTGTPLAIRVFGRWSRRMNANAVEESSCSPGEK